MDFQEGTYEKTFVASLCQTQEEVGLLMLSVLSVYK